MNVTATKSVSDELAGIIVEHLGIDTKYITPESTFLNLGADTLELIGIACAVEELFDVELDDDAVEGIETVGDLVKLIENKRAGR